MPFFFEGHQRLSLWYFSPNHCAVVLVASILLLCAVLSWLKWRSIFCSFLRALGAIFCLCLGLLMTIEFFRRWRYAKTYLFHSLSAALVFSALASLAIVLAGCHFQKKVPWLVNGSRKIPLECNGFKEINFTPSRMQSKIRLLMFTDNVTSRIRPVALPLCELGIDVTVVSIEGKIGEKDDISTRITIWLRNGGSEIPSTIVADSMNVSNAVYVALASLPAYFQPKCALFFDIIHGHPFKKMAVERLDTKVEQTICNEETTSLQEESSFIKTWLESKRLIMSQGK